MSAGVGVSATAFMAVAPATAAVDVTAGYNRSACTECQRRKQKVRRRGQQVVER